MAKTETKTAIAVELELPPQGGNLSVVSTLEEDAHYLRVTLDKSENFKVAAGEKLRDLLLNKFGNNRNALRDWYEDKVAQGKAHRAWNTVQYYLGTVLEHGPEIATQKFAEREQKDRDYSREYHRTHPRQDIAVAENVNEINEVSRQNSPRRIPLAIPEYDQRKMWLADMNWLWFKANREWQNCWLQDRNLSRGPGGDR